MKGMVLAAGQGSRLRPLTNKTPKVLLPVGGVPVIVHIIAWLRHHGVDDLVINISHLGDRIRTALGDGASLGVRITYSPEKEPLGTAGGVKRAAAFFDGPFVVAYGDVLTDFDLSAMQRFHREKAAAATLAILKVERPRPAGVVEMDADSRIIRFAEKPQDRHPTQDLENAGVYILEPSVLPHIPASGRPDFGADVFPQLLRRGLPVFGYVLGQNDHLIDIGSLEKYQQADANVRSGQMRVYSA